MIGHSSDLPKVDEYINFEAQIETNEIQAPNSTLSEFASLTSQNNTTESNTNINESLDSSQQIINQDFIIVNPELDKENQNLI